MEFFKFFEIDNFQKIKLTNRCKKFNNIIKKIFIIKI